MPTDLHTALQREREACDRYILAPLEGTFGPWIDARRATDQALAALETRPTLAEVEAAVGELAQQGVLYPGPASVVRDRLSALYGRGGVE